MKARYLARELALLTLFQLEKQGRTTIDPAALTAANFSMQELMLAAVRTLSVEAESQIRSAASTLASVSQQLLEYEADHPENLKSPIGSPVKPVPVPTTREMVEKIESCLQSAEYLFEALRIPEAVAHSYDTDVRLYAEHLVRLVVQRSEEIDELLNRHSQEWRVERMAKMDRYILRLAAAEIKFEQGVDPGVSINEAVELAKQFSGEDSYRLINGILGAVAEEVGQPARS